MLKGEHKIYWTCDKCGATGSRVYGIGVSYPAVGESAGDHWRCLGSYSRAAWGEQIVTRIEEAEVPKPEPEAPGKANVYISSSPKGATAWVPENREVGKTPITVPLTIGNYRAKIELNGYNSASKTFVHIPPKDTKLHFSLVSKPIEKSPEPEEKPPELPPPEIVPKAPPKLELVPSIYGTVTNKDTGAAIIGATINFGGVSAMSMIDGSYTMSGFEMISGPITCALEGYKVAEKIITAPSAGSLKVNFTLESIIKVPEVVAEPEISVRPWEESVAKEFGAEGVKTFGLVESALGWLALDFLDSLNVVSNLLFGHKFTVADMQKLALDTSVIIPTNQMSKIIFNKSIFRDETGEMTDRDWGKLLGNLAVWGGAGYFAATGFTGLMTKLGIKPALAKISTLWGKALTIGGGKHAAGVAAGIAGGNKATMVAGTASLSKWIKIMVLWNVLTDWVWIQNMLRDVLGAFGIYTTPDYERRIKTLRFELDTEMKALNNKINFAEEDQEWKDINERITKIGPLLEEYGKLLKEANVQEALPETWAHYELMVSNFAEFAAAVKKEIIVPTYPKEFELKDVEVLDGDSIKFPDHPEAQNEIRMLGLDTHESETDTGIVETAYLESLIGGKTVTVKVHQHHDSEMTYGLYGRLLAGIFIGGEDVALMMLRKFGKNILTDTKYQKKYRWIDWDEYKKTAKEMETGKTGKVKITSKPSNAHIWIDHKDTRQLTAATITLTEGEHIAHIWLDGHIEPRRKLYIKADETVEEYFELEEKPEPEEAATGNIKVNSKPSYADIWIDETNTNLKSTETIKEVPVGTREVTLKLSGYDDHTEIVDVTKDKTIEIYWDFTPPEEEEEEPEVGEIKINTKPSYADIWINDENTNLKTAETLKDLSPGTYKVTLKIFGYDDHTEIVEVKKDERIEIYWDFKAAAPEEEELATGEIKINTKPSYADIWIDGENTKLKTAETLKKIPVGSYEVTLKLFGFYDYTETVNVEKNKRVEIYFDFTLPEEEEKEVIPTGKIKIYSKPTYCKIEIDGKDTGMMTVETFELTAGDHEIRAWKDGWISETKTITIIADKLIEERFELEAVVEEPEEVPLEVVPLTKIPKVAPPVTVPPTVEVICPYCGKEFTHGETREEVETNVITETIKKVYVARGKYGLHIDTEPDAALVRLDGRKMVYAADHTYVTSRQSRVVTVEMDGYGMIEFMAELKEKQTTAYYVDLKTGKVTKVT